MRMVLGCALSFTKKDVAMSCKSSGLNLCHTGKCIKIGCKYVCQGNRSFADCWWRPSTSTCTSHHGVLIYRNRVIWVILLLLPISLQLGVLSAYDLGKRITLHLVPQLLSRGS